MSASPLSAVIGPLTRTSNADHPITFNGALVVNTLPPSARAWAVFVTLCVLIGAVSTSVTSAALPGLMGARRIAASARPSHAGFVPNWPYMAGER